ncbi:hypothetical protein INR49_027173 [Caranx melampygus]|nr:hypothetical protein INR49_027173 [Caranx melampygus]
MGLRSRSVSSVAGMGIDHSPAVPFGFYTPRGTDPDRAGGGSGGTTAAPHGTGYQDTGGGGHHTDGVLYLGSRGRWLTPCPCTSHPAGSARTAMRVEADNLPRYGLKCLLKMSPELIYFCVNDTKNIVVRFAGSKTLSTVKNTTSNLLQHLLRQQSSNVKRQHGADEEAFTIKQQKVDLEQDTVPERR